MELILIFLILLYSIILHEISHGYVAYKLGDPTAKYEGRLTLNPISHIDFIGTILLPAITFLTSGFIFGWAKPVPYNPFNLKNPSRDSVLIALAGPLTNILLMTIFLFFYKIFPNEVFLFGIRINLILALFNLLPIPPLDGSKILLFKIPIENYLFLEMYGILFIFLFLSIFGNIFFFWINKIFYFLISI